MFLLINCNEISEAGNVVIVYGIIAYFLKIYLKCIFSPKRGTQILADLNKDGQKDLVKLIVDENGGGCGSITINLASDDESLNKLLVEHENKLGQSGWGHNSYEDIYDVQIFEVDGKAYVLGNSELISLWNNQSQTWGEFESFVQHHP